MRSEGFAVSRRRCLAAFAALACRSKPELPVLGSVPEFSLVDQNARPVTRRAFDGKVWVAAFMFTRCPTICPRITQRMRALQVKAREQRVPLTLVSFSVDPENDTPPVLRDYAARYQADLAGWSFLTGDYSVISRTAVEGFKLALEGRADAGAPDFGILHGSHLVLVDRAGSIRGFYRTSDDSEMERLLVGAAALG